MADVDTGPALVSMAQQFSGLPMRSLIGGPLKAAAEANSTMAVTQTKFMLDTCFYKQKVDEKDKEKPRTLIPIMVTMEINRSVIYEEEGKEGKPGKPKVKSVPTQFELPLLTIIPLNSLAVDEVQVNFDMEVKSSYSDESSKSNSSETQGSMSADAKLGGAWWSVEVKGSVSYDSKTASSHSTTYQKSNSAQYSVSVHAGQQKLPEGVTTIIQAFTNSISPIELDAKQNG